MATVNTIKTRILNKYDVLSNYSSFTPLKGEICVAEIPTSASDSGLTPPAIGIKVGDGQKSFSALPWIQAIAGDIPSELKTAAGIDAQIAALTSGRKLATASELSALATRVTSLETRTTDSTIGNEALSTRINTLSSNKVDKTVAEDATTEDKLIKYSTASTLASTAKSEAIQSAATSAAGLYEKIGVAETKVNALANGQVKTNTTNISANATAIAGIQEDIGDISTFSGNDVSTAIKNLQTAVGTGADGLATKVSTLEDVLPVGNFSSTNTVKNAIDTAESHIGTLSSLTTTAKGSTVAAINELDKEIGTVANLNNKKSTLVEEINAVDARVTATNSSLTTVSGQVNTLIGSDTGKSVRAIATAVLTEELIPEDAAESLNTLEEIAAWIQDHPGDAAAMNARLEELKTALGGTGTVDGGYTITSVSDQIDAKINTYNTNTVAKTYATQATVTEVSNVANAAKATADTAVQEIATGSANGTISVDGSDVAVKGLGSAAYTASTAYATAAQGKKADSAVQSVTVLGHTLNNGGSVTVAQAKTALGLGSAAYENTSAFDAAGSATAVQNAINQTISEMDASFGETSLGTNTAGAIVTGITQVDGKITSVTQRKIKNADLDTSDVFVFYCGNATGYDSAMSSVTV